MTQPSASSLIEGTDQLDKPPSKAWRKWIVWALIPVAFALGLGVGYFAWGKAAAELAAAKAAAGQPRRFEIGTEGDPYLGPADAPITIVEFSDFNCGYCKRFHLQTFPELMAAYPDQIRFVYRDFPVTSQESYYAAQAAQCAGDQGAFWEFHNLLFEGELGLGTEAYSAYAEQLGLDPQALLTCITDGTYAGEVEEDARFAAGLGASGTPTFFINGLPMMGAQPLEQFQQVIDAELEG
jgi:protein-disulfide isomerase